jgi:hypothetical protein
MVWLFVSDAGVNVQVAWANGVKVHIASHQSIFGIRHVPGREKQAVMRSVLGSNGVGLRRCIVDDVNVPGRQRGAGLGAPD